MIWATPVWTCRSGRAERLHAYVRRGFEHNLQSLRVVDVLETRYPQFDGINLKAKPVRASPGTESATHAACSWSRSNLAVLYGAFWMARAPAWEAQTVQPDRDEIAATPTT